MVDEREKQNKTKIGRWKPMKIRKIKKRQKRLKEMKKTERECRAEIQQSQLRGEMR